MNCDMKKDCTAPVTHIGSKGYIYCKQHAIERRQYGSEQTRQMRAWELKLIRNGQPLPSYQPIRNPHKVNPSDHPMADETGYVPIGLRD